MAYEADIRRQAGILRDMVQNIKNEKKKVRAYVEGSHQWWKGNAEEAFVRAYKSVDEDADRSLNCMQKALDGLNRLPALIQRAEREHQTEAKKKRQL